MGDKTQLTVRVEKDVVVVVEEIERKSTKDPEAGDPVQVIEETPPPSGYVKAYRWNAAGCAKITASNGACSPTNALCTP